MAQLCEIMFSINLPGDKILMAANKLKQVNSRLQNVVENGCLSERLARTILAMDEEDKKRIGQKEIVVTLLARDLRESNNFYAKARFFQKSVEVLDI